MRSRISLLSLALIVLAPSPRADSLSDLLEQGHYKRAEAALRPQLQQNPNDPLANCLMSKVDIAFNRFDEAISHAEKAVSGDGNRVEYHAILKTKTPTPTCSITTWTRPVSLEAARIEPRSLWLA